MNEIKVACDLKNVRGMVEGDCCAVVDVDGAFWYSDGRVILLCDGPVESGLTESRLQRYRDGIARCVRDARSAIARDPVGESYGIVGSFLHGYYRKVSGPTGQLVYIDERYVRAVPEGALLHVSEGEETPIIAEVDGAPVAIIMPMKFPSGTPTEAVPFLEDAVLYHVCEGE